MKEIYLDGTEKDNSRWLSLIEEAIRIAKRYQISKLSLWNRDLHRGGIV